MSPINSTSNLSIRSLANQVSGLSTQLSTYFSTSSQPEPDFTVNSASVPNTSEYEVLRAELNDAALDLLHLIDGSPATLRSFIFSYNDLAALQIALERRFLDHVPLPVELNSLGESATTMEHTALRAAGISEIAERAGMDEDRTGRVLRLLATQRIFEEVEQNGIPKFQHTASSAIFARDRGFHQMVEQQ